MIDNIKRIQENPVKSTIALSIPIIVLLFLDTFYAVADLYWIGSIGTSAIVCMGYISNAVYVLSKMGDGIGRAVNVLISNAFGARRRGKTKIYAQHGMILIFAVSIIIPLIGIPIIKGICFAVNLDSYADLIFAYLAPILGFIILSMMNNYFSSILGSEGDTKRATIIIIAGNLINLVMDPILIFHFGMGMLGAGFATIIGCGFAFSLFIYLFYIRKDTLVKVDFKGFEFDWTIIWQIVKLALPIIFDGLLLSIVGVIINYALHVYATPVAAFAYVVLLRIQTTVFTPVQGLSKSLCIVTGHLAGAKRFSLLRDTVRRILLIALAIGIVTAVVMSLCHIEILSFFSSDQIIYEEVRNIMMFLLIILVVHPILVTCNYVYVGLEKSVYSLYFLIFNVVLFVAILAAFDYAFGLTDFAIFMALITVNVIESALMLVVMRIMLANRIAENEGGILEVG